MTASVRPAGVRDANSFPALEIGDGNAREMWPSSADQCHVPSLEIGNGDPAKFAHGVPTSATLRVGHDADRRTDLRPRPTGDRCSRRMQGSGPHTERCPLEIEKLLRPRRLFTVEVDGSRRSPLEVGFFNPEAMSRVRFPMPLFPRRVVLGVGVSQHKTLGLGATRFREQPRTTGHRVRRAYP